MKTITIEIPETVVSALTTTPEEFARELRLAAAIEWFREGRISQGKGAEIAGMNRWKFLRSLSRLQVDVFQVTADELKEEVERTLAGQPRNFSATNAERFYQSLGAWKGPLANRESQHEALAFWRSSGAEGVRWLVQRLRGEHHVDALHGAASLLSDLGEIVIGPIFEKLAREPSGDQTLAPLRALVWLSESEAAPRLDGVQAELILVDLLQNDDPDVREAAARALRLLPHERVSRWLSRRLRNEADPDVRATIEEELERVRTAKV